MAVVVLGVASVLGVAGLVVAVLVVRFAQFPSLMETDQGLECWLRIGSAAR